MHKNDEEGVDNNGGFKKFVLSVVIVLVAAAVPALIVIYAKTEVMVNRMDKIERAMDDIERQIRQLLYRNRGDIY